MRSSDLVMLSAALLVGLGMTAAVRGSRLAKARAIETEQAGLAPPPAEAESGEMDHSKMDPGEMDQGEMDHSKMDHSKMGESDQSAEAAGVIDLKNEKCPVRGGDADPDVYVDYEGVRVHFCCPGCEGDFLKEPQKYLKKLGIDDLDAYKAKHGGQE